MQIREAGKLNAGDICAVDIVSTASKRLFYRTEDGIKFLVDTGAEISVLAATVKDKRNHHSPSSPNILLVAANNTRIKVFGTRVMTFLIRPGVKITWEFIIADVDRLPMECSIKSSPTVIPSHHVSVVSLPTNINKQKRFSTTCWTLVW